MLLCLLLLFPMSSDPLSLIPPERLASWPLRRWQRVALRLASLGLSPVIWLVALILWKTASLSLAAVVLALAVLAQLIKTRKGRPLRLVPRIPGRLGGVVRLSLREMLSVLDVYLALVLSLAATAYRLFADRPNPAAFPILSFLVGLALSTYAQSLFGLDLGAGMTRYRLLPLRGWEILLAKDAAYLGVLLILVLPLSPAAGLTFGIAALAIGHHTSVCAPMPQYRWRFAGGRVAFGAAQTIAGVILGFAAQQRGVWVLGLTALVWCASLVWYGRRWDRSTGTSS